MLHEFGLMIPYAVLFIKRGYLKDLIVFFHAVAAVCILGYLIWVVLVFLKLLREERFGPFSVPEIDLNPDPTHYLKEAKYHRYCRAAGLKLGRH